MTSGLETIKNRILEKAREEAATLVKEAIDDKNQRLAKAREEAKRSAFLILEDARNEAETRYEEKLGSIRTELRRELLVTREEMIEQAWSLALDELGRYVQTPEYVSSLKELVISVASLVEGDIFRVEANARDLEILRGLKGDIEQSMNRTDSNKTMIIGEAIDCIGGVEISDADRKVILDRTYEAKIRRLRPELRSRLAKILTGGLD